MPAMYEDATGAALIARVIAAVNGSGVAVPVDPSNPLPMGGSVAHGGTGSSLNPVLIGGIDANSVTLRRFRVGVYGDQYVEGGSATSRLISAANSTNATVVKASAGKVFTITGYNAAAALRYIKFYNKATAPTVGTDTPVLTYAVAATAPFQFTIPGGFQFATGIGFALTVNAADSDTTALTAGDITVLHINYT